MKRKKHPRDTRPWRGACPLGVAVLLLVTAALAAAAPSVRTAAAAPAGYSFGDYPPDHLVPQNSFANHEMDVLFTPLTRIAPNGKPTLMVAQSITTKDNRRWLITLKKGWTFQDGSPVTARSFVDAWNAAAYGPNAWSGNYSFTNFAGYAALNPAKGKPTAKKLKGLTVLGPLKFSVTLVTPDNEFLSELSQSAFDPLPPVAFTNSKAFASKPIGNGPYMMTGSWHPADQSMVVKRYPGYKGPAPASPQITFRFYNNLDAAYTDVLAGNTDIVFAGADLLSRVHHDFGNRFASFEAPSVDYISFPLWDKRFQNVQLRQALSLAIDRQAINKAFFDNFYIPATALVAPSVPGAQTGLCGICSYDPTRAKTLLAAAGGWSGQLTITYPSGFGYDQLFQAVGNQLRQNLGIDVTYTPEPFSQFNQDLYGMKLDGLARGHWGSTYPSFFDPLGNLFTPFGGAQANGTYYNNQAVTNLINGARATTNAARSHRLYAKAQRVILGDAGVIPLFFDRWVYVHTKRVSNVIADNNGIELAQVHVGG